MFSQIGTLVILVLKWLVLRLEIQLKEKVIEWVKREEQEAIEISERVAALRAVGRDTDADKLYNDYVRRTKLSAVISARISLLEKERGATDAEGSVPTAGG